MSPNPTPEQSQYPEGSHAADIAKNAESIYKSPATQEKANSLLALVEGTQGQLDTTKKYVRSARGLRDGILWKLAKMGVQYDAAHAENTARESETRLHEKLSRGSFRAFAEFLEKVLDGMQGTTVSTDDLYKAIIEAARGQEDPFWKWFAGSDSAKKALKSFLKAKTQEESGTQEAALQTAIGNQRSVQDIQEGFPQESIDAIMATLEWAKEIRGTAGTVDALKVKTREKIGYVPDAQNRLKIFNDYKVLLGLKEANRKIVVTIGGEDFELHASDLQSDRTEKMNSIGALFAQGPRIVMTRYWEMPTPEKKE